MLVAGNTTLDSDSGVLMISGDISDDGAGLGIQKTGAGTVVLSGNNNYLGSTTVSRGTLVIATAAAIPSGTALTVGDDSCFITISAPSIDAGGSVSQSRQAAAASITSAASVAPETSEVTAAVQPVAPPVLPASLTNSLARSFQRSVAASIFGPVAFAQRSNLALSAWMAAAKLLQSNSDQWKGDSLADPKAVDAVLAEWT